MLPTDVGVNEGVADAPTVVKAELGFRQALAGNVDQSIVDVVARAQVTDPGVDAGLAQRIAVQQALGGISEAVSRITGMSQQIATASEQQSHVVEDINQQIVRIAQLCDRSAGQAREGAEISQELERMAGYLHDLAERFNR